MALTARHHATVELLRELYALGVKRVVLGEHDAVTEVEFFELAGPPTEPAPEPTAEETPEEEIPPNFQAAFNALGHPPNGKKAVTSE